MVNVRSSIYYIGHNITLYRIADIVTFNDKYEQVRGTKKKLTNEKNRKEFLSFNVQILSSSVEDANNTNPTVNEEEKKEEEGKRDVDTHTL
jgi:hypothetical protein